MFHFPANKFVKSFFSTYLLRNQTTTNMKQTVSTSTTRPAKKDKMDVALRPNNSTKWWNRIKAIASTVGDSHFMKVNIFGVTSYSTTEAQSDLTTEMNSYPIASSGASSAITFVQAQETIIFNNRGNRFILGKSDQG